MSPPLLRAPGTPSRFPRARDPTPPPAGELRLGSRLERAQGFDLVFGVVRDAVRRALGVERPGLGLVLSNLPPQLGAYWQVAGNMIVLNEGLVETMRAASDSPLELNAFVYVILAHEYLHALGYLDEREVRRVTAFVTQAAFGPDHLATKMAQGDLWQMYPFLAHAPTGDGRRLKVVRGFDLASTQNYIR